MLLSAGSSCNKMCIEQKRNPDCVCMAVYEPVCGCNGVTYSNACGLSAWALKAIQKALVSERSVIFWVKWC